MILKIQILGTRGIPAAHGGFETFAEHLALFLVSRGHDVLVYGQGEPGSQVETDTWCGVRRISIPAPEGAFGTILFDARATIRSLSEEGLPLVCGYNTAILNTLYRLAGRKSLMNMDGIEWRREKWSRWQRTWLRLNEWLGAKLSTHLIADHPEIANHLSDLVQKEKITTIPYGANAASLAEKDVLESFNLKSGGYAIMIARPEPENSVLEVIEAFSKRPRGYELLVLGKLNPAEKAYHRSVINAAGPEVRFIGPLYDRRGVASIRAGAKWYAHGHRVGGTNPSLVESLAAGNPVLAHDNRFNRWVAGSGARYFQSVEQLDQIMSSLSDEDLLNMQKASRERHAEAFTLEKIHAEYERLLLRFA